MSSSLAFFGPVAEYRFAIAQRLLDEELEILPIPGEKGMFILRNATAEFVERRKNQELLLPFEHAGELFFVAFA